MEIFFWIYIAISIIGLIAGNVGLLRTSKEDTKRRKLFKTLIIVFGIMTGLIVVAAILLSILLIMIAHSM